MPRNWPAFRHVANFFWICSKHPVVGCLLHGFDLGFCGCEEGGSTFSSGGIPHFRKTRQTVRSEAHFCGIACSGWSELGSRAGCSRGAR